MTALSKEEIIAMAREAGFKASIGKTDKEGNYHPNVNALGKDVPIEWVERLIYIARAPLVADVERLKRSVIRSMNLELDLKRVLNDEATLNDFDEVKKVESLKALAAGQQYLKDSNHG